ncbi:MAG: C4-dicarboxylate TRAP transporter substrate-binding protein [Rhodospirillum sp.]|nr:C4-dicarboxylate TRAP transporter substrate-binding protein [Rhodospirillum sp.]MCF8491115.1 C4-dicarboxylate TRAP transporter substrate-binding protein [Rhodospirillum sp.]MCF8502434.1 C4-dicarboxylate TRAP transporter substrate-binding protein [Rhodospirillum sp.]
MSRALLKTTVLAVLACFVAGEAMAVEWNVSLWGKRRAFTENTEKLAELVKEKTNGAFTLNLSYGGLSKNTENLDGISFGAFEMAQFCAGYHPDKNPSLTVLELPFLGVDSLRLETDLSMAVYTQPAVVKDMARWNAVLLMPSPMPQYNLAGVGEAPTNLKGLDGLRVRAVGGIGDALKALGAIPTSMTATDVYNAMESGVVDGATFAPHAHVSFRVTDIADWWTTNLNPGTVNCPVVANKDALEALSPEHREALLSSIPEALDYYIENYNNKVYAAMDAKIAERGIKKVTFDKDAIAEAKVKIAEPAAQAWVKEMEAKGIPGQELYDFVKAKIEGN